MIPVYRSLRFLEKRATVFLTVACLYEALALTFPSNRVPPITVLSKNHWWFFPAFCGALWFHVKCYEIPERQVVVNVVRV